MLFNITGTVYIKRHRGVGAWVADFRLSSVGQLMQEAFGSTVVILTHSLSTPFVSVALHLKVRHPALLVHREDE